jgi:hypothetical protein
MKLPRRRFLAAFAVLATLVARRADIGLHCLDDEASDIRFLSAGESTESPMQVLWQQHANFLDRSRHTWIHGY